MSVLRRIFEALRSYIFHGNERSVKAKINIFKMVLTKSSTILIGLILVPLTLDYVDSETYGIWMTISSIVAWIQFFDIGIGNGLKNKLAEALANHNYDLGKRYVSTTYAFLSLVFIPLSIALTILIPFINWQTILNISTTGMNGLVFTLQIATVYFCLNFILSTINTVMTADQNPSGSAIRTLIQQSAILIVIFILTKTTTGSLLNLCLALCVVPLIIIFIFNISLFKGKYKIIAPSFKTIDFELMPDLMKLGGQFFIIQIAVVIQYQLFNFIIMRYFGAENVTAYNVANKLFGVLFMFWSILTTPLWVGITDAIVKEDYLWIKNTMYKYTKLCILFFLFFIITLAISPWIFNLWIGDKVYISTTLSICIMLYNYNLIVSNLATSFINGAGILKVQTIMSCITPFIFLGLSLFLISLGFGIESVFIAAIVANVNGIIIAPIQTYQYIKKH